MTTRMRKINRIHLVGIGGTGMGGIAEVLLSLNYEVQGSDLRKSKVTQRLEGLGAEIFIGHDAAQLGDADVVVVSSAIDENNPEIAAARELRKPVVRRAEMLAELMRFRESIAVAGTHGKTTTTSLVASVLAEAGEDPTFIIGGRLISADTNGRLGAGRYLVAEADESDASFMHLKPVTAVVTNIDSDHMSTYGGDIGRLRDAFLGFLHNLPFYGLVVACCDDPGVAAILPEVQRPVLTYGVAENADFRLHGMATGAGRARFTVSRPDGAPDLDVDLSLPGHHNMLNATAAIAIAHDLGLPDEALRRALAGFAGIDRRLQSLGEVSLAGGGSALFIDDYGHHPTEIAATLEAVRGGWPERRVVLVFQPHRYSRTHELLDDFAEVLSGADQLFVAEVFAAGEQPISGADGRAVCRAVRGRGRVEPVFVADLAELPQLLSGLVRDGDLVLTMGAGSIGAAAAGLPAALAKLVSLRAHK